MPAGPVVAHGVVHDVGDRLLDERHVAGDLQRLLGDGVLQRDPEVAREPPSITGGMGGGSARCGRASPIDYRGMGGGSAQSGA